MEENEVILSDYEISIGAIVGAKRNIISMKSLKCNKINNKDFGWHVDIEAACAEIAFAKRFGHYYDFSVNTFKKPDVAGHQVRHTQHLSGCLFIRDGDPVNEKYVLVVGQASQSFFVCGWIWGHEAKQDKYKFIGYNDMPDAWKVQQHELHQFEFDNAEDDYA